MQCTVAGVQSRKVHLSAFLLPNFAVYLLDSRIAQAVFADWLEMQDHGRRSFVEITTERVQSVVCALDLRSINVG